MRGEILVWHVKKEYEDSQNIAINYSFETDDSCDGLLLYDKVSKEISIVRLSKTSNENVAKRAYCPIRHLLSMNGLTEQKKRIATG